MTHPTIKAQLEPLIRELGIRETSRRTGIAPIKISSWLNGRRNREMSSAQVEALAAAVGCRWVLVPDGEDQSR